jgi:hypothetical protein
VLAAVLHDGGHHIMVKRVEPMPRPGSVGRWPVGRANEPQTVRHTMTQHDIEGLVTWLLLEKARLQSLVQDMVRSCTEASREHRARTSHAIGEQLHGWARSEVRAGRRTTR